MVKLPIKFLLILFLAASLGSCNLPYSQVPATEPPDAAYTAAVETIVAQLTEVFPGSTVVPYLTPTLSEVVIQISPTSTQEPTITLTPQPSVTQVPTATGTPVSNDPRAALGDPDWTDTLKNSTNWSLYADEHASFDIDNGILEMVAFFGESRDSWLLTWPDSQDYYLEAEFRTLECSGLDRYGFIIRSDANTGYLVGLSCDGQVSLRRWNGEQFRALLDWSPSTAALSGANQINRLGVMVKGDQFSVYVNGTPAGSANDDTYSDGSFGVFIGSKITDEFQVDMAEISYWEIPE